MDVDNDIEGQLLQQFSCLGTQDKEVLIKQFQNLLGTEINDDSCAFYLDMNNWNLQAAIGSYYDLEQQPQNMKVPCMALVQDITIGEGESVPPNTPFVKTWRVKNTGPEAWPPGCSLRFIQGEQFGYRDRVLLAEVLEPGMEINVSVEMMSPGITGIYQGQWRMQTATGMYFGEMIWVILQVEEHGLLGVTQKLSNFGSEFSHTQPAPGPVPNPFASPVKNNEGGASMPPAHLSPLAAQNLFGSPTPSMITHHGSLPSSPASQTAAQPPDMSGASPARALCTALFPASNNSDNHLLPNSTAPSTNLDTIAGLPTPPATDMDSSDMT